MKTGTFIAAIESDGRFRIPEEIRDRLALAEGDKIEIMLKKIRSKKSEVTIHKNPLIKLLDLSEVRD